MKRAVLKKSKKTKPTRRQIETIETAPLKLKICTQRQQQIMMEVYSDSMLNSINSVNSNGWFAGLMEKNKFPKSLLEKNKFCYRELEKNNGTNLLLEIKNAAQ